MYDHLNEKKCCKLSFEILTILKNFIQGRFSGDVGGACTPPLSVADWREGGNGGSTPLLETRHIKMIENAVNFYMS